MVISALKNAFKKSTSSIVDNIIHAFIQVEITETFKENLLENLLLWDTGVETSRTVVDTFEQEYKKLNGKREPLAVFKEALIRQLPGASSIPFAAEKLSVILVIGVNGSGKTTLAAKLAGHLRRSHKRTVMFAACDTFRAAAGDQLQVWADRLGIDLVGGQAGSDPASIAFDAVTAALARGCDTLIVDTAGRLHTKDHLMQELDKIKKVIMKNPRASIVDTQLVLDATNGSSAVIQAEVFCKRMGVTSLVITKLDSSFKAGFIFTIQNQLRLPIRFIGIGEQLDDIVPFDRTEYVESLFSGKES